MSSCLPRKVGSTTGIAVVVLGYVLFTMSDSAVKWLSGGYSVPEIVFFTALFSILPMLVATVVCGGPAVLGTGRPGLHLVRGGLGLTGCLCGYYAIGHMPLADFYAVVFTAPLFITALSAVIAQESVGRRRWLAVALGFAGVLVMVQVDSGPGSEPGLGLAGTGTLAALGCALCYALSVLLVRRMGGRETAVAFGTYGALVMVGGAGLLLPSGVMIPDRHDLLLFAVGGIGMGAALLCVFTAFGRVPAAVLAPFQYTQMIWGVLVGLFLFGERPDHAVIAGSLLVVGSGLYVVYHESRAVPVG